MTSHINSVIIEGYVKTCEAVDGAAQITIESQCRIEKEVGGYDYELYQFIVIATGKIGAGAIEFAKPGKRIRVIGRLSSLGDLHIVARHFEIATTALPDNYYGEGA